MPEQNVIRIMCPNLGCQRILTVPNNALGKLVRCRSCSMSIRIPTTSAASASTKEPDKAA